MTAVWIIQYTTY